MMQAMATSIQGLNQVLQRGREGGRKEVEGEINDLNTHTCYIVNTCGFKHVPTHAYTHTHTHTYAPIHTHAHAHAHTHTQLLIKVGGVWGWGLVAYTGECASSG